MPLAYYPPWTSSALRIAGTQGIEPEYRVLVPILGCGVPLACYHLEDD